MPVNASSQRSTAAEAPELTPRDHSTNRHQQSRAIAISGNPTLAAYLSELFRRSGWTIAPNPRIRGRHCVRGSKLGAVVVCDDILPDGRGTMPRPPPGRSGNRTSSGARRALGRRG